MTQPTQTSNFGLAEPRHASFSNPHVSYSLPETRHPRIDTLMNSSQPAAFSNPNPFDQKSPASTELNYPFNGSPHGSMSGGDIQVGGGYPGQKSPLGRTSVPGMIMPAQNRSSVGSIGSQGFNNRTGSVGGSDQWSPNSGRGQPNRSDESLTKVVSKSSDRRQAEEDKLPSWSELKTKAGKERKRLPLACIACRRKKIRCSGEKPACKHCLRSRTPCVYKVTTRKAAPRTDYMAMLDKRLKRMEERVIKIIPKEDLPDMTATGRSSVRPPIPGQSKPHGTSATKKRSADEAFLTEMSGWTQSTKPVGLPDTAGRLRKQQEGENRLFIEGADDLPPSHIQEHLAEVFFDCIYGQSYLLLHKPSFMRKLKAGTVPPVLTLAVCAIAARFSTHPQVSSEPAFLRGAEWATPARKIVEKRHYEPNITILTVMLILGLHYFGTCEGGLSWSFGGQAMRMAYALQLHKELDRDPLGRKNDKASELSFTDREIRRRTMWACFLMDTFNSSGTERPSFGNEDYVQIQLPIKESHFQMEVPGPTENLDGNIPNPVAPGNGQIADPRDNMGVAAYVIRAVVLWKRIVTYLNLGGKEKDPHPIWDPESKFTALRRQTIQLRNSLPPDIVYSLENLQTHSAERVANQFLYLHIILAQCTLFLNRFAVPTSPIARPPKDMPKQFLSEAGHLVVEAAHQISTLIEEAAGHMLTVPFAGYCAYAASTVQVWGIFSKNPSLEASSKENLRHNYKYLNRMKKYWGMFHYMAESVKDIYRHFADAAMKNTNQLRPMTPSNGLTGAEPSRQGTPMFQYGDWFDKYPHGVSEAEWEEGHHEFKKEHGAEAVMSQRSDLQSVEEFFASLSPPSKGEESRSLSMGVQASSRKVQRRRGKSVADSKFQTESQSASAIQFDSPTLQSQQGPGPGFPSSITSQPRHQQPFPNQAFMDATSPTQHQQLFPHQAYHNPNTNPLFDLSNFGNLNQNAFNFSHPLPQLDRQIVMGAYAGVDRASSSTGPGALNTNTNTNPGGGSLWDSIDMNGMGTTDGFGGIDVGGDGGGLLSSTAWFMPFNLEPPVFGGGDPGFMLNDFGSMDGSAGGGASFSGPSAGTRGPGQGDESGPR